MSPLPRLFVPLVAALVALVGCGSSSVREGTAPAATARSTAGGSSAPAATATTAPALTLGVPDAGRTVTVRVGQRVVISLQSGSWLLPETSAPDVLLRSATDGGYPTPRPATATFTAVRTGPAELTATSDLACAHTTPRCLVATRRWSVQVDVR